MKNVLMCMLLAWAVLFSLSMSSHAAEKDCRADMKAWTAALDAKGIGWSMNPMAYVFYTETGVTRSYSLDNEESAAWHVENGYEKVSSCVAPEAGAITIWEKHADEL